MRTRRRRGEIGEAHRLEVEQPGHRFAIGQNVDRREVTVGKYDGTLGEQVWHGIEVAADVRDGRLPRPARRGYGEALRVRPQLIELEVGCRPRSLHGLWRHR